MKRKAVAALLGTVLTLSVAGSSALAMTSVFEEGKRTVYIYGGAEEVYYSVMSADGEDISCTVTAEGEYTITSVEGTEPETEGEIIVEDSITFHVEEGEVGEGSIIEYTVTDGGLDQLLSELEAVGITENEETGELFYEGKSIRWLLDEQGEEECVIIHVDDGELDVFTVRDAQGMLTGVSIAE